MKTKGVNNYSRKEIRTIKFMIAENKKTAKPMNMVKLSKFVAAELGRASGGVYTKMLEISPKRAKRQPVATKTISTPRVETKKSITFGKPTKIEISDSGMTFFFN